MSRYTHKKEFPTGRVALYLFMTVLAAFMMLPIVFLISQSLKPIEELFLFPPRIFVRNPTLENFRDLLLVTSMSTIPFTRYVFNSVFVSTVAVLASVAFTSMAAYPLAKDKTLPGRNIIFTVVISALMFAPEVTQIPRYLIVNGLGLLDTYWALILPWIGFPLGLFLMRQFLEQVPDVLLEAARIDGASEWTIFSKIVMPMVRPAQATVTVLVFIAIWNDTWGPMVFTHSEVMKTLPLAVQTITGGASVVAMQGANFAATAILTLPTIIIFMLMQSRVLQTMAHSGIKA